MQAPDLFEVNHRPLTADNVVAYLSHRGLDLPAGASATELSGGVSGTTLRVDTLVVKQALTQLRVAQEWRSDPARAAVEASAMGLAGRLTPGSTPLVVDVDPVQHAFTMTAAPAGSDNWRDRLLAGTVEVAIAARTGAVLGRWHAETLDEPSVARQFETREWFVQLRVEPFYDAVMASRPGLAIIVADLVAAMLSTRSTLVHGDYSPKNVLVLPTEEVWVVDFEVAHFGDPSFDLAFMLHHLMLKAVHLPDRASELLAAAQAFLTGYRAVAPGHLAPLDRVLAHTGCLLLARVLGKSPAGYLTAGQRRRVEAHGVKMIREPSATLSMAWPDPEESRR